MAYKKGENLPITKIEYTAQLNSLTFMEVTRTVGIGGGSGAADTDAQFNWQQNKYFQ